MSKILIEACVASVESARFAAAAGADRIELNLALELDGLTPSAGLLARVAMEVDVPIIAMVRPRAGDFVYSSDEWATMLAETDYLVKHGVDGIAFGCLTEAGEVDGNRCRQIQAMAAGKETVFHKAFDVTANWQSALDVLIETGVDRVMTSGQAATATEGREAIAKMVEYADGRIEVLPAGGVSSANVAQIVQETKASQVHGSFSSGDHDVYTEIQRVIAALEG